MKNKNILYIAVLSLFLFVVMASYLWYLYFHDYESKIIASNPKMEFIRDVELINTGGINYVNAKVDDIDGVHLLHVPVALSACDMLGDGLGHAVEHAL